MVLFNRHLIHMAILAAVCFLLHSGNYNHEYLLDSPNGLIENPAVRSLENIPDFFKDPSTLTNNRQNWDYRPVLQVTYVLNYWISGYEMWSWHLLQIVLHFVCVTGLYFLCQRILAVFKPFEDRDLQRIIAFVTALFFAVHPYTSGVVNYLWARSSLLTGALLLFSIFLYTGREMNEKLSAPSWGAFLLYSLALFTKVEAVAVFGVYWLYEVIRQGVLLRRHERKEKQPLWKQLSNGFLGDVIRSFNVSTLYRLWPFLVVTFIYALIREQVVPDFIADSRHSSDVTPYIYFSTQLTAWWYYIYHWFAPVDLVADNLTYPIFKSLLELPVLLALSGWALVAFFLAGNYRRNPEYMFIGVAAMALVSPTSSISPLAEMVNEHRPYIPLAILSMLWLVPACRLIAAMVKKGYLFRLQVAAVFFVVLVPLCLLTLQRNRVYTTGENYWYDILQKAPSSRAHVNYGLEMRNKGQLNASMDHFRKSLELAPFWHITHINLAIGYELLGDAEKALYHYTQAVQYEMYGMISLEYRGNYYLRTKRYREAVADFEKSLEQTTKPYSVYKGIAQGASGLGDWQKAVAATEKLCELDGQQCEYEIVSISTPYWGDPELYVHGMSYFQALVKIFTDRWWVYHNIADLAKKTGNRKVEKEAAEKELLLKRGEAGQ